MLWRMHAQRLLVERGKLDVMPGLLALLQDQHVDDVGLNVGAIHALWTIEGLKAQDRGDAKPAVVKALEHPSAAVRRNAVASLPRDEPSVKMVLGANLLADPDPLVRMACLLLVAEAPRWVVRARRSRRR